MSRYDAESRSRRLAEQAAAAWYQTQGGSNYDVAVGVVAAMALVGTGIGLADTAQELQVLTSVVAREVAKGPDEYIAEGLAEIWSRFWLVRPDLGRLTRPFNWWLQEGREKRSRSLMSGAAAVARAAVKGGLLDMAERGLLADCDVIGAMYLQGRSNSSRQARGEFYTPPHLCKVMAQMIMAGHELKAGMSLCEPAAGTGGMLQAAAEWMRESGFDPGDFWWVANDISPVPVAGLAVNAYLWGLGPHVILGVADTLANPSWYEQAWQDQLETIQERDRLRKELIMLLAIRQAEALISAGPAERQALPPGPAPKPRLPLPKVPGIQLSLVDQDGEVA